MTKKELMNNTMFGHMLSRVQDEVCFVCKKPLYNTGFLTYKSDGIAHMNCIKNKEHSCMS